MNRREFMSGAVALTVGGMSFEAWCREHGADYDFDGIVAKLGWNPKAKDAFCFLHATDLHMTENPDWDRGALQIKDKFMGRCFVDDMNALKSKASFAVLTGDLTSSVTMNPATWPWAEKKWRHFRKYVSDRLELPYYQFIGNNDCAIVPYLKAFPEQTAYWKIEKGGILFLGLHGYDCWKPENTNHAGIKYGPEQLAWAAEAVRTSSARTLVLFTHEGLADGDSHCARAQLGPIVDSFRGEEVWNIHGHNHSNTNNMIRIGHRNIRCVETMTPVGIYFTVGDGGFRVFFCQDGLIHSTALRWLTPQGEPIGFARDPQWKAMSSPRWKVVEESFPEDALQTKLVGVNPFELGTCVGIEDRIADYYIHRPWTDRKTGERRFGILRFAVPTTVDGRKVHRILLRSGRLEGHFGFSLDGTVFDLKPVSLGAKGDTGTFALPETSAAKVWIYLSNESKYECKFYGYALLPEGR